MAETDNRKIVQGEDIIILLDDKPTLHATTHNLKVDLELKDIRTKDTNGKEKFPGDISWSVDGDGLVVIDPAIASSHSSEDVLALVLSKKLVKVVLKSPVSGLKKTYSGEDTSLRSRSQRLRAITRPTTSHFRVVATLRPLMLKDYGRDYYQG